ncbi:MAG: CHRD domain-containing protein [Rhodospirillaceae bacterium]|nr:CHRD domain-containing protein [Rhodospirillaceae bacterium]
MRAADPIEAERNIALGPVKFYADLSAAEQAATTESDGVGRAEFTLDRATVSLSWTVTFKNLTSPATASHVHGPQRVGTNAGVQIDLAPNGMGLPLKGSAVLTDAQLEYLLSGRMYVNVHTTKYPAGELRGQIQRVPPPQPLTN